MNLNASQRLRANPALDFARGLAAVFVLLEHLRGLFFVGYSQVNNPNLLVKALYFSTGLGHQAVLVFFVLSGYLVSASVFRAWSAKRWGWFWYLNNRLTRLWIVLIPALLLGAALDQIGMQFFANSGLYAGRLTDQNIINFAVQSRSSLDVMLGNLLFLQGVTTVPFGSNGALWSLSYEFWYYIIFPCLLLVFLSKSWLLRALYAAIAVAVAFFIGYYLTLYFLLWLFGVALNFAPLIKLDSAPKRLISLATAGLVFVATLIATAEMRDTIKADFIGAAAFTLVVYVILSARIGEQSATNKRQTRPVAFAAFLAGFSYTLYLVHLPLLVLISAVFTELGIAKWQPTFFAVLAIILIGALALAYAWGISRLTEANTERVRKFIARLRRPTVSETSSSSA